MSNPVSHDALSRPVAGPATIPAGHAAVPAVVPGLANVDILYWLHLGGFLTGITPIIALVMAYTNRGKDGDAVADSHYSFVIRTFWIGTLYGVIGVLTAIVVVGFFIIGFVGIWWIVRCVIGINRASRGEAIAKPGTWLW